MQCGTSLSVILLSVYYALNNYVIICIWLVYDHRYLSLCTVLLSCITGNSFNLLKIQLLVYTILSFTMLLL